MAFIILLAGLTSLKGTLAEILAADLSCKENKYMHALGYLVNMILHAYSYIAIHLRSYTHSYVRMLYLCIRMYIAIVSVVKLHM